MEKNYDKAILEMAMNGCKDSQSPICAAFTERRLDKVIRECDEYLAQMVNEGSMMPEAEMPEAERRVCGIAYLSGAGQVCNPYGYGLARYTLGGHFRTEECRLVDDRSFDNMETLKGICDSRDPARSLKENPNLDLICKVALMLPGTTK